MTPRQHSEQCTRDHEAVAAFDALYPKCCHACDARGVIYDAGGREEPPTWIVCECVEEGHCPRCGGDLHEDTIEDEKPCPHCGWCFDDKIIRPYAECLCGEYGAPVDDVPF